MTVKEAISQRRSIRKFKNLDVPEEVIYDLIDCARLAPSACNSQPWRFKIVKDKETIELLSKYACDQKHVANAPVIIVCCAHVKDYISQSYQGNEELYGLDLIQKEIHDVIQYRTSGLKDMHPDQLAAEVTFNAVTAIEHIVLRAVELGLGSCIVKLADEKKIRELFQWDDSIRLVSLLTLGYPDETPKPIKRLSLEEIIL